MIFSFIAVIKYGGKKLPTSVEIVKSLQVELIIWSDRAIKPNQVLINIPGAKKGV